MFADRIYELYARWEAAQQTGSNFVIEDHASPDEARDLHRLIRELEAQRSTDSEFPTGPKVGEVFSGFRLLGILGEGGFGRVFRAHDLQLNRKVALKVLHERTASRPGVKTGFLAEARALASVQHDNVVPIYQVGEEAGQLFLSMPLLGGETLASRIDREGSLPVDEVRRIGRETAAGLAAIHAKGLVHRDLKPANIWLEAGSGRVKVLDLGLAQDPLEPCSSTAGTPSYMSPEQTEGRELDFRSDLFSLGSVLYECASGRRPFKRDSAAETLRSIREVTPPPLSYVNPGVPGDLSSLVERMQSKNPADRPASAAIVAERIAERNSREISKSGSQRLRNLLTISALAVLIVVGIVFVARWRPEKSSPPTHTSSANLEPLRVLSLDVRPYALQPNGRHQGRHLLGTEDVFTVTSDQAIGVSVQLSRAAYAYILVFRADGEDDVLYPQDKADIPEKSDRFHYPSKRRDELYAVNNGVGLWLVAVIASDEPLPAYRDWRAQHASEPWKSVPAQPEMVMKDDGVDGFEVHEPDQPIMRGPRAGTRDARRTPVTSLVDWLRKESGGVVTAIAFPVTAKK